MAGSILIENARVLDGLGHPAVENCSVLVQEGVISSVGTQVVAPEGVARLDAKGATVMPGLIDCHCHISFGEARTQEAQDLYTSVESRTLRSAWNLEKVLRAGVTGFSAPGGSYYIGVALRDGVRDGMLRGPRITTAGRFISTSNGIADFYPTSVGVPESSIGTVANTLDEMLAEVRVQVKNGVDIIKLGDSAMGDYTAFRFEEIAAMTELAHQLGAKVTIHARGSEAVEFAVRAGVDWIMHGDKMTDDVIELLADSKIPLCPTITLMANLSDWGHLVGVPAQKRDAYKRHLDEHIGPALRKAAEAGVPMMTGTDSGFAVTPFGEWHAREVELLMEYAGLSGLEAIKAATSNSALTLGLQGKVGMVQEGALADLLVVDGQPENDPRVLLDRSRLTVITDGTVVEFPDRAADSELRWPYDASRNIVATELLQSMTHGSEPITSAPHSETLVFPAGA